MDGSHLAERIKTDLSTQHTLLVMLSSVGQLSEMMRLRGHRIDACLVKPIRQSHLQRVLLSLCSSGGGGTAPTAASQELPATFRGASVRVLVAEDNSVNQKVAIRMFERMGVRADIAANGREAVEMWQMFPYDLVFMDCQMPEMDGYQASREIRKREHGKRRIPIVAMTAEALGRERCLHAGMDDFVSKPVRMDELLEMVRKWSRAASPAGAAS
jgi:CheY-like chemotaxis protein